VHRSSGIRQAPRRPAAIVNKKRFTVDQSRTVSPGCDDGTKKPFSKTVPNSAALSSSYDAGTTHVCPVELISSQLPALPALEDATKRTGSPGHITCRESRWFPRLWVWIALHHVQRRQRPRQILSFNHFLHHSRLATLWICDLMDSPSILARLTSLLKLSSTIQFDKITDITGSMCSNREGKLVLNLTLQQAPTSSPYVGLYPL
jgi:hypothetical protein